MVFRLIGLFGFSALCVIGSGANMAMTAEILQGPAPAPVLRVVDGDTLVVSADIWLGQVSSSIRPSPA